MGSIPITRSKLCACSSVDRVPGYEPVGHRFESYQARQKVLADAGTFFLKFQRRKEVFAIHYIVTGAEGFLGRHILSLLTEASADITALKEKKKSAAPDLPGVTYLVGDICSGAVIEALFAKADSETVVIHTAGHISVRKHCRRSFRVNTEGTERILNACRLYGVKKLVHIASVDALLPESGTVAEPEHFSPELLPTAYGKSKAIAAQAVMDAMKDGLSAAMLFPSAIIGPEDYRGGFISQMLNFYRIGPKRIAFRGGYEFVDVRDVAQAAVKAAQSEVCGPFIVSNAYASVKDVYNTLAEEFGYPKVKWELSLTFLKLLSPLLVLAYRLVGKEPPLSLAAVDLLKKHPTYTHERAERLLGFSPRLLKDSILDTYHWIRKK